MTSADHLGHDQVVPIRGVMLNGGPVLVDDTGHVLVTDGDEGPVPVTSVAPDEWITLAEANLCRGCPECNWLD